MSERIGTQVSSDGFWPFLLRTDNHRSASVLYVPDSYLIYAIGVVIIHLIIGCELWVGVLLEVLGSDIFSEDAIVSMVFLDDDYMRGCHYLKGMFSFKGLFR